MNVQKKSIFRSDVVNYMYLVATRNKAGIENKSVALVQSLENQSDLESQGLLLFVKGITLFFQSKYQEAKMHFEKIGDLYPNHHELLGIANMGLGFAHRSSGQLDEAVTNLFSGIELIDKEGEFKEFLVYCYHQLGEIHTTIHEYDIAILYFNNAFAAATKTNASYFRFHMGIGGCYLQMKDYEKSKFHLTKALEVEDLPAPIMSRIENDLGVLYLEMREYDTAETWLTRSLTTREANGLEDAACTSMTALAEVYLDQNRIAESLRLLDRCLMLVDKFQAKWKKIKVLSLMAVAYSKNKNYELAVDYYEQYSALYGELRGEQERNIFKFKNAQIEKQKKVIQDKHNQLAGTFEEIKRLKVNRKAVVFSWITIIILVLISELFLDPLIENYSYNTILSLLVKVMIALLFKPIDGLYEKILWDRTIKKVE